jgi:2-aminoethylphosphonate-pyruvate transaminase
MVKKMNNNFKEFINKANSLKSLYTAGPSSLLEENIEFLQPCFGRNDHIYKEAEEFVINYLARLSSHKNVVRLQGSATLALEIGILNFCRGRILIIETGYYSNRLLQIAEKQSLDVQSKVDFIAYEDLNKLGQEKYDWIIACYTETSIGLKIDIDYLNQIKKSLNSRLLLDATASIGIENKHELADVICYSSCKGLFGLTGSSFIAFNDLEIFEPQNSYYLSIKTHLSKGVTGPYHSILSLYGVFQNYDKYLKRLNKWHNSFLEVFKDNLVHDLKSQPKLCTMLNCKVKYLKPNPVPYKPRIDLNGSIICHIGQIHNKIEKIDNNLIKKHFTINR